MVGQNEAAPEAEVDCGIADVISEAVLPLMHESCEAGSVALSPQPRVDVTLYQASAVDSFV